MKPPEELSELAKTALQKIGWNVLCFQRMEWMLKILVGNADVSGSADEIEEQQIKKQADAVSRDTMGQLSGKLSETVYGEDVEPELPEGLEGPRFATRFRVGSDAPKLAQKWKADLKAVIEDRNDLIHHQLHSIKLECDDSCRELIDQLDEQYRKLQPVLEWLEGDIGFMNGARSAVIQLSKQVNNWHLSAREDPSAE